MNPYDTLGVPRDADADAIKAAYRSRAQATHPDREGGDAEEFKRVQEAYTLLSDPERRARYDKTGATTNEPTLDEEVAQVLDNLFRGSLDVPNVFDTLEWCRVRLDEDTRTLRANYERAAELRARLVKRRDKIQVREGKNRMHELIDLKVQSIDRDLRAMEHMEQVGSLVRAELGRYLSTEADSETIQPTAWRGNRILLGNPLPWTKL